MNMVGCGARGLLAVLCLGAAPAVLAGELLMPPIMAKNKAGHYELTAVTGTYGIVNGPQNIATRSFTPTGQSLLVAPTLRARPGEAVKLRFANNMPFESRAGDRVISDTIPHGFDILNLHTHGLHVSPRDNSDNVLLNILPANSPQDGIDACKHGTHHDVEHKHVCIVGSFDYEFRIPDNHPAGTYWYHPHKHGSVSIHLGSGMAGALIIEDEKRGIDSLPAVQAAKKAGQEKVLVLQEILYARTNGLDQPQAAYAVDCITTYGAQVCGTFNQNNPRSTPTSTTNAKLSVNGQFDATISLAPGEAQLWRVVNATVGNVQPFCLVPMSGSSQTAPSLYALAADGIPIQRPVSATAPDLPFKIGNPVANLSTPTAGSDVINNELLFLAAGQRLDLMVQAPAAEGRYALLQPSPTSPPAIGGLCQVPASIEANGQVPADQLVMYIDVKKSKRKVSTSLPTQTELNGLRVPVDLTSAKDVPAGPTQGVVFGFTSGEFAPTIGGASVVNGRPFNAERVQRTLKLGQMDRWAVQSAADTHMFHIHINPFQIVQRGTVAYDFPIWRDTALINCAPTAEQPGTNCTFPGGVTQPSNSGNYGEVVQFLSRAVDFTGAMVMHCHNVGHEDNGMMELVELVK